MLSKQLVLVPEIGQKRGGVSSTTFVEEETSK